MKCFLKYNNTKNTNVIIVPWRAPDYCTLLLSDWERYWYSRGQAASASMFAHGRFISTSFGLPLFAFIMSPGLLFLLVDYNFVTLVCAIVNARIKPMTSLFPRPFPFYSVRFVLTRIQWSGRAVKKKMEGLRELITWMTSGEREVKVTCIFNKHSTMSFSHRQAYMIEECFFCYLCFNKACFQHRLKIDFCKVKCSSS